MSKTDRIQLDADVAQAQRDALPSSKPETQAQRDKRMAGDRHRAEARAKTVEDAQLFEAHRARLASEALTPAERAELRDAGERFVRERHQAVIDAVDAENAARAKAIAG